MPTVARGREQGKLLLLRRDHVERRNAAYRLAVVVRRAVHHPHWSVYHAREVAVVLNKPLTEAEELGLKEGDKITIEDLLYGLMLCSRK